MTFLLYPNVVQPPHSFIHGRLKRHIYRDPCIFRIHPRLIGDEPRPRRTRQIRHIARGCCTGIRWRCLQQQLTRGDFKRTGNPHGLRGNTEMNNAWRFGCKRGVEIERPRIHRSKRLTEPLSPRTIGAIQFLFVELNIPVSVYQRIGWFSDPWTRFNASGRGLIVKMQEVMSHIFVSVAVMLPTCVGIVAANIMRSVRPKNEKLSLIPLSVFIAFKPSRRGLEAKWAILAIVHGHQATAIAVNIHLTGI